MNKIKKALLLALSLAMSATLFAACGKDKGNGGNTESSSVSAPAGSESSSDVGSENGSDETSSETPVERESSEESSSEVESESESETSSETPVESESESESSSEAPVESESESESSSEEPVVDETAPVFGAIDKTVFEGLKVGDTIAVPTVTATDETDGEVTVYATFGTMMMQMPTQMGEEITFEFAGTYILKYTAQDEAGNVAEETIEIVVACEHDYTVVNKDETNHWLECECGAIDESTVTAHDYTVANKDETNHWLECECGAIDESTVTAHDYTVEKKDETNHWKECECGAIDEASKAEHEMKIVATDAAVDTLACECGYADKDYSFNKVVTAAAKTFNINDEAIALDLTGIDAYESVKSIKLGDHDLGADINALVIPETLKADTASHGKQDITVCVVDADGYEHLIAVPVTIVTAEIASATDFSKVQVASATSAIYGYYVLTADISGGISAGGGGRMQPDSDEKGSDGKFGFRGTFDGGNHTISSNALGGGLFCGLGAGAVIKNVTFTSSSIDQNGWESFLACYAIGATIEDVTFNFNKITSSSETRQFKGLIFEFGARGCAFNDVVINITGNATSLFGFNYSNHLGFNANQQNYWNTKCTFSNTTINLLTEDSSLSKLGEGWIADAEWSSNGKVTQFIVDGCDTVEGENTETVEGITLTSPRPDVKLANQDLLTTSETVSLNLGDYAACPVQSIALNGVDIGTTDVNAITLPAEIKGDPTKHGTGNTYTVVVEKDGAPYKIAIPVTLVTDTIATEADFAKVQIKSTTDKIYGYYVLTANIGTETAIASVPNSYYIANANGAAGFMGTLDGRGYTITYSISTEFSGGLFGAIGNGAVIKDVTFDVPAAAPNYHMTLFGGGVVGATFNNVDFKFKNTQLGGYGLLSGYSVANCKFESVNFYIEGKATTLLAVGSNASGVDGLSPSVYGETTFTNCKVVLAEGATLKQIGTTYGTVYVADGCTETGTKVDGITIVKAAE